MDPDTKRIEQLVTRLEQIDTQLRHETEHVIEQYSIHRQNLRDSIVALPDRLSSLEEKFGEKAKSLREKLAELEVQLALERMESEEAYREQREQMLRTLAELGHTLHEIEVAEDDEGVRPLKDFGRKLREVADHLSALHIHFALQESHAGEDLAREKENLRKKAAEFAAKLKSWKGSAKEGLKKAAEEIRLASHTLWYDGLGTFFQFQETDEDRREREELDRKAID